MKTIFLIILAFMLSGCQSATNHIPYIWDEIVRIVSLHQNAGEANE